MEAAVFEMALPRAERTAPGPRASPDRLDPGRGHVWTSAGLREVDASDCQRVGVSLKAGEGDSSLTRMYFRFRKTSSPLVGMLRDPLPNSQRLSSWETLCGSVHRWQGGGGYGRPPLCVIGGSTARRILSNQ